MQCSKAGGGDFLRWSLFLLLWGLGLWVLGAGLMGEHGEVNGVAVLERDGNSLSFSATTSVETVKSVYQLFRFELSKEETEASNIKASKVPLVPDPQGHHNIFPPMDANGV